MGGILDDLRKLELYHEYIRYDRGLLYWIKRPSNAARMQKPIGTLDQGYLRFLFKGSSHRVHRVVWMLHYGLIPKGFEIDHINHDKADNRIENLRCVPKLSNGRNQSMHRSNTSGITGVNWMKSCSKWRAEIRISNKTIYLGVFDNLLDAVAERRRYEVIYGFHANHGK